MKLEKVSIAGFRSILDEQVLFVDEFVTILIGANDHGKTNILEAIETLNDDKPFIDEDRHWDSGDKGHPEVKWFFTLTSDEVSRLTKIGEESAEQVGDSEDSGSENEELEGDEHEAVAADMPELQDSEKVVFSRSGMGKAVEINYLDLDLTDNQVEYLSELCPRIELFHPETKIIDRVTLAELDQPRYEFMKGLFMKAEIWDIRDSIFTQTTTTSRQLDDASILLIKVLQKEWEQGKNLTWKFKHSVSGNTIELSIEDPAVKSKYVLPSQRSSGFTNFFVLSLTIFARTRDSKKASSLFLFDEPGTYLHPIAQINLQRVIEALAEESQIIYTTHSIFLVNKNVPSRNRVIRKSKVGTEIDIKPYIGNWKSVRESLGILLSHNFLISERTLLVEGASDALYILTILRYLVRSGSIDIDLNDFSIADAGDSRNYVAMASLMLNEGQKVVAIVDGDNSGKGIVKTLNKVAGDHIKDGSLECIVLPDNQSIEDLIPRHDLLINSIGDVIKTLVSQEVFNFADGMDIAAVRVKIDEDIKTKLPNLTLGAMIDRVTKECTKPHKKVSKLNIATIYEDYLDGAVPDEAHPNSENLMEIILKLNSALELRARKAEREIFEASEQNN